MIGEHTRPGVSPTSASRGSPPTVRGVLDGAPIAHLAAVLPDGSPHSTPAHVGTHRENIVFPTQPGMHEARDLRRDPRPALSVAPAYNPFEPVVVRGRVVERIDGDRRLGIIDRIVAVHEQTVGAR